MAAAAGELGEDMYLDGRLRLLQPRAGYRAGTDPVLLAAACPAKAGESALDMGCGIGTAGFCLAARVPVRLSGIEIQSAYAALAARNAERNGIPFTLYEGDIADPPRALRNRVFDHVIVNPPFHEAAAPPSPTPSKDAANREGPGLAAWLCAGLARVRPKGRLTVIHRADRLAEILKALDGAGDIAIKPLTAREGRDAKRVIVRARKGVGTRLRLCAPLVLHDGSSHGADGDDFSAAARAILRNGEEMVF